MTLTDTDDLLALTPTTDDTAPTLAAAHAADGAVGTPRPRAARGLAALLPLHGEARRVVAFLVAGGLSALVTLSVTSGLTDLAHAPFFWAALAGTELGILVNFALNDRQTFQDLAGHRRALPVRLLRYHLTCALGQSLILLASLALHDLVGWSALFAQALPITLVTGINFLMHRFWTYRPGRANPA